MIRFLLALSFLLLAFETFAISVPIRPIGNIVDHAQLSKLVQANLIKQGNYRRADMKIKQNGDNRDVIVHLVSNENYSFETAIMTVNKQNKVISIARNAIDPSIISVLFPRCPDTTVDVVYATACDDIGTAVNGVNTACDIATAAGYKCRTLIGNQATVAAYKNWMACPNLKGFGNIGHGNTSGILLANGETLSSTYFNALATTALNGLVIYYNSCQVHNNPLEPAIMHAGTRTYVGGNVNLGIGTSEEVFKCFWDQVTDNQRQMGAALTWCEQNNYPTTGAHGISGQTNYFKSLIIRPPVIHPPIVHPPIVRPPVITPHING
ncbi:MAG: hypothetical protein HQK49_06800 [Oligoflexia bacterium]|nr:hypothetical protein [Oligoflexia bacterium]